MKLYEIIWDYVLSLFYHLIIRSNFILNTVRDKKNSKSEPILGKNGSEPILWEEKTRRENSKKGSSCIFAKVGGVCVVEVGSLDVV